MKSFIIASFLSVSSALGAMYTVGNSTLSKRGYSGDGTWYAVGLGACGINNVPSDLIAAVAFDFFDNFPGATANPNLNPLCGRKVKATYKGKSVVVRLEDKCSACKGDDLDFSVGAFKKLAPLAVGRLHGVTWKFVGSSSGKSSGGKSKSKSKNKSKATTTKHAAPKTTTKKAHPTTSATTKCSKFYTAVPGDSVYALSQTYGFTNAEFLKMNPQVDPNTFIIYAGHTYCVKPKSS